MIRPNPKRGRAAARLAIPLLALAVLATGTACAKKTTAPQYELVWQDEFDGPANQSPNPANWGYDVGTDWGNAQLEYDTARPENVSLDGAGNLDITARQESWLGQNYTSGRIQTRGKFEQAGGKFEARMRLPSGRGMWPAFWLLGNNIGSVGWPQCGEVDIMEYRGQEPTLVHGSLHGPGYSGGAALTRTYNAPFPLDGGFHVYTLEWTSSKVTWALDGVVYSTITPSNVPAGGTWVFNHPFFIVLDLAVGGNFVGSPDAGTAFPQALQVDYVRVYKAK
jgi:beta-glucanase (GH16 family)